MNEAHGVEGFPEITGSGKVRATTKCFHSEVLLSSTYQPGFLTVSHRLTWMILRERRFHCEGVRIAGGRGSASENRPGPKQS